MAQSNLGAALSDQGTRASGAESQRLLGQAVAAYRAALEVYTREQLPQAWARTQNDLGWTLAEQGWRAKGATGLRLLKESEVACRAALEVNTREHDPKLWAMVQDSLDYALSGQGFLMPDDAGKNLLRDAIDGYRQVLQVVQGSAARETQEHLSLALKEMGKRTLGDDAARYRAEAEQIDKELAAP